MNDIAGLGSILGVWAHPDDESFMAAGLFAQAVQNGQKVALITATKGDAGETADEKKWPRAKLRDIREKELRKALRILGIKNHHFLSFLDGKLAKVNDKEGLESVLKYIKKYQPNTIITFAPDGLTGHDDHKAVSRWAKKAIEQSKLPIKLFYSVDTTEKYDIFFKELDKKFNFYFNIDHPNLVPENKSDLVFKLNEQLKKQKLEALKAMESQTHHMQKEMRERRFLKAIATEAFINAR